MYLHNMIVWVHAGGHAVTETSSTTSTAEQAVPGQGVNGRNVGKVAEGKEQTKVLI